MGCRVEVQYLTPEHLQGFDNYKYSSMDTSPLSNYIMHPFWNSVIKICPMWIAPNVLTFAGFLFTVANFVLLSCYDFHFYASGGGDPNVYPPVPRWVWALAAFNLFMSHTLDGIDGKQARRTGSSGPLGELFDHGLDSWTTVFIPTGLYSVFGRDRYSISIKRMFFCYWNVFFNFIFSHWEKYNTGILYLPWGYDASMVACFFVFTVTAVGGHEIWKFDLPFGFNSGNLVEFLLYAGSVGLSMPMACYNVYRAYKDKTGKMRPFLEAGRPLYSSFYLMALTTLWIFLSPADILMHEPRMFFYMVGTVFSHICCRLIVAQMSNTRCDAFDWLLFPVTALSFVSVVLRPGLAFESTAVYVLAIVSTITQLHYGICVVRQMCRHFHIDCFRIKDRSD